jgi:CheY-like chemotaxis protein
VIRKKVKILVVEDEPMLRDAYRHVLHYKGYKVASAADGEQALVMLDKMHPDIVLLDVLMPQLDGIGFLQKANIKQKYPRTKVIACTNLSDSATAQQLEEAGADKQVLKSDLSPGQLIELIETMLPA